MLVLERSTYSPKPVTPSDGATASAAAPSANGLAANTTLRVVYGTAEAITIIGSELPPATQLTEFGTETNEPPEPTLT
jgi:hypothetical protein